MTSIGVVNASSRYDGISFGTFLLSKALSRLGYAVRWYQCVDRGVDPFVVNGSVRVKGAGVPSKVLDMALNRAWVFPRRLRNAPDDVLLLADPTLILARRGHPTTVVRVTDLRPLSAFSDRMVTRLAFRYALPHLRRVTRVIVPTRAVGRAVVQNGVNPSSVYVVPDSTEFRPDSKPIEDSIARIQETGQIRVLCVSTDRPFKNIPLFLSIAAAASSRPGLPAFKFTLVSILGGPNQRRIREMDLRNLEVVSHVPNIAELYRNHDVLVFPSQFEGFGRPLLEAMTFGMPIIAFRAPAAEEVLGGSGMLLETTNVRDWMHALDSLTDMSVFATLAKNSFERSKAFGPEQQLTSVKAAFEGL
jgi:glycosyltransferase involved in cell wall biosynthesis